MTSGEATKRGLDLMVAGIALAVTAPLQAAVALLVRVRLGRPVLFRQVRAGRNGRPFELVKFRTMVQPRADEVRPADVERLTPLGTTLRRWSLDELPTLWNVLRGDLSLVGPRPLPMEYLPLYSDRQARRHEVRPGITGLAVVRGRNALDWPARLAADVEYVDRRSLWLDVQILVRTVGLVITGRGVSAPGEATTTAFTGEQ